MNSSYVTDDDVLAFLRRFIAEQGYAPSLREIAAAVGLAGQSSVLHHLERLEHAGRIRRGPRGSSRTISLIDPASLNGGSR